MEDKPETTVLYRLHQLEQDINKLKSDLELYVPVRVNDLQLNSIREAVGRIEKDVGETKKQLQDMSDKLVSQENEAQKIQIRVLVTVLTTGISALLAILIGYITHFFH